MAKGKKQSITQTVSEDEVFERIAAGESLNAIALSLNLSESGMREWIGKDSDRSAKYARAREARAHRFAERIAEIANDVASPTGIAPDRARVAIDALKWTASKLLPRQYGDKVEIDATVKSVKQMTDEELLAIIQQGKA